MHSCICDTDIDDYAKALDSAFEGRATILKRMRLSCKFHDVDGTQMETHCEGLSIHMRICCPVSCVLMRDLART